MSQRHLFNSADGLVNKCLRGIISYNPSLSLNETNRVVFDTGYDASKVVIISGGGSGHEPAWTGYVGKNMLAASVAGDIFASPSTKQILAAIRAVPSDKGSILVVTNYTGDCLHFGLANEKAVAAGYNCRMIICGDDVSVGRKGNLVGRRGLAGQMSVLKVMGAAAGAGASIDEVYDLGLAFSKGIVSIAATLDHCHVPGRREFEGVATNEIELGTGPHNEPGHQKLAPQPSVEELVAKMLKYCLDETDPQRGYVRINGGDEIMLLVSNFGGISYLEMGALVDEVLNQLDLVWKIAPVRICAGQIETSLNASAFSLSLINITNAAANCSYSTADIKDFLDAKTTTHWESMTGYQSQVQRRRRCEQFVAFPEEPKERVDVSRDIRIDPATLEILLRQACIAVIAAEPDLTRWDTIMGDGDCGETLKTGALGLLKAIESNGTTANGSIVTVLREIEDIVESKMGGTLGGILGIFFVSLRNAVEQNVDIARSAGLPQLWAVALSIAVSNLQRYTPAQIGDRTVMDTLIRFTEGMKSGNVESAVKEAIAGAEGTRAMTAKLGRATYVGFDKAGIELPPDPGAWGAMVAIRALCSYL